jgi:hypothetical protein
MIHVYPNPADAAIAALDTSNLDVAVSTRASQSSVDTIDANVDTLVTNVAAIKADTDAYLDVAVSSVRYPVQTDINRADGMMVISTLVDGFAIEAANLDVSPGGSYTEVLNVNAPGILWWASCHRGGGFSAGTLNIRITIDGTVALLTANASTITTVGSGVVGVGYISNGTALLMPLRFKTSLKIEVTSSVSQSNAIDAHYLYTLD